MRLFRIACLLSAVLLAGCVSRGLPRPVMHYDEQNRLTERKQYDRTGFLLSVKTLSYPDDAVCVERATEYDPSGARTESETFHIWDTPVSYRSVKDYDPDGSVVQERSYLLPTQRGAVDVIKGWTPDAPTERN